MKNKFVFITLLSIFLFRFAIGEESKMLDGFSLDATKVQLQFEKHLKDNISTKQIEKHLQWLTSRPHRTGTEGAKITAEYIYCSN